MESTKSGTGYKHIYASISKGKYLYYTADVKIPNKRFKKNFKFDEQGLKKAIEYVDKVLADTEGFEY